MGRAIFASLFLAAGMASANTLLPVGTYQLHDNWQNGTHTTGLLLDHAFNTSNSYGFSFDAPGADVKMEYTGTSMRIFGTVYGGMDWGNAFAPSNFPEAYLGFYTIDFTYNTNISNVPGDGGQYQDVQVTGGYKNFGSISGPGGTRYLTDQANSSNLAFLLGDGNGSGPVIGVGWLAYCASGSDCKTPVHVEFQDWNFRADVPEPDSVVLVVTAMAGLMMIRRRRII